MSVSGIQGRTLEVKVVGCTKLRDTEWITKQDPFVQLEYGDTMFRTKTCRGGHKNPYFNEEFKFTLIEGLRELNVRVWNKCTVTKNDFIGIGKVKLEKVLSGGNDDSSWALKTEGGSYAGEIQLYMHYSKANIQKTDTAPHAPSCGTSHEPSCAPSPPPPPPPPNYYQPPAPPPNYYPLPTPHPVYPPAHAYCPPQPYYAHPQQAYPPPTSYPQQAYPPPLGYPQQAYPPPG